MSEGEFRARSVSAAFTRPVTNIDRRKCVRTVPMEVLCLGLGRTGTSSLREAFYILGYQDVYHLYSCVYENKPDMDMWHSALQAKFEGIGKQFSRQDWDRLLGHCQVVCDAPASHFAPELISAYPDAKIILSVRDSPAAWKKSMLATVWDVYLTLGPATTISRKILRFFLYPLIPKLPMLDFMQLLFKHTMIPDFPERGEQLYTLHNDEVLAQGKLHGREVLVYNVKEGWAPLCSFLGKPIPVDENGEVVPFPRINDTKTFKEDGRKHASKMIGEWFWSRGVYLYASYVVGAVALIMAYTNGSSTFGWMKEKLLA